MIDRDEWRAFREDMKTDLRGLDTKLDDLAKDVRGTALTQVDHAGRLKALEASPDAENRPVTRREAVVFALGGTALIGALKFLKVL